MVTGGADREGLSPEIPKLEPADGLAAPAGNTRARTKGERARATRGRRQHRVSHCEYASTGEIRLTAPATAHPPTSHQTRGSGHRQAEVGGVHSSVDSR
jgi:hypothetical protein